MFYYEIRIIYECIFYIICSIKQFFVCKIPIFIFSTSIFIFNIFPIPTTYNVTITSERNEEVVATLSDINGRELMNFVFVNSTELDLSDLDKGIYILNLNTKEGSISKKLIIE